MQEMCQMPPGPIRKCTPLSNSPRGKVASHFQRRELSGWLGMALGNSDRISCGLTHCRQVDRLLISSSLPPSVWVNNGVEPYRTLSCPSHVHRIEEQVKVQPG